MKKNKQIIIYGLVIYPLLICGCNANKKDTIHNNSVLERTENTEIMNTDSNCMILNNISLNGKEDLFKFIKEERIEFFRGGPGSFGISIGYSASSFIFPLFSYWLERKNYHPVSESIFNDRIKEVFNINLSDKNEKIISHKEFIEYWTDSAYEVEGGDIITEGSFLFSAKYKLFFRPTFNGLLVDEINTSEQYQACFEEKEYHYNNFIFNNSKSSLTWLINNDLEFLEILVKEFGYDKEVKINKTVLNKIFKEYQDKNQDKSVAKDLFFKKDCNGNLQIREGLMEYLVLQTTTKNPGALKMLEDYGYVLAYNDPDDQDLLGDLTPSEKDKLAAYIFYYVHKAYQKNDIGPGLREWNPASVLYNISVSNPELIQRIKDNHYYYLPGFDEMIRNVELQIYD